MSFFSAHIDGIRMFFRLKRDSSIVVHAVSFSLLLFYAAATHGCAPGKTHRIHRAFSVWVLCEFWYIQCNATSMRRTWCTVNVQRKSTNWFSCDADVERMTINKVKLVLNSNDFHHSVLLSLAPTRKKKSSRSTAFTALGERSVKSGFS